LQTLQDGTRTVTRNGQTAALRFVLGRFARRGDNHATGGFSCLKTAHSGLFLQLIAFATKARRLAAMPLDELKQHYNEKIKELGLEEYECWGIM